MKPSSKFWKRLAAGFVGLAYAALYGFLTMLATGGGHGNFIWLMLFVFVEFFGIYIPLMAILAVDLRSRFVKIVFGALIGFNIVASCILIGGWITEAGENSDFSRQMEINGFESFPIFAALHFLPTFVFGLLLIRAIWRSGAATEESAASVLDLQ
jgi:hypothetical protein